MRVANGPRKNFAGGGSLSLDTREIHESVSQKSCERRSSSKKHPIKLGREKEDYKARASQRLPTPGVPEIALKYGPGAAKTCKISLLEDPANDSWLFDISRHCSTIGNFASMPIRNF